MPIREKEQFIQISGFKLFTKLYGEKTDKPTIVMDAGYGDYSKTWSSIINEISLLTEVLVYDRAGLGKSEKSLNPRTSQEMVEELNQLLIKMKIQPPYILVGHSFGGVNMRIYATKYPNNVAALLLIDSTPESYKERFLPTMSKEFQQAYNDQFIYESTYDEFTASLKQLKQTKQQLNVPLIVLSAGKKDHYSKKSQELWNEMQKEILEISTKSELIIAENSTHYIQNDEPFVVIDAIQRLINNF
ncbi:alpha/beta fold hydrolase [Bacillus sp. BP-3]|uniref:alpha/beta fold hydrolase n=1 Tax=Bacillus sp. BP-3 TaxID=3022773 RepID=UPI00232CD5B5|nr:alpha/beta hydrolase [Bacillus sp. BP-3]MDC2866459.1 alpha/beta hydrolase [Bacillus sp. BP-3]